MFLQYNMIHYNVFTPKQSTPREAGLDLRLSPADTSLTALRIEPGESCIIPTGWRFAIQHG